MHEVGIASSILEASLAETARRRGARLTAIGVRVGVLSGVDVDALRFAFECIVADTEEQNVVFTVEACPRVNGCDECGHEFDSPSNARFSDAPCPRCQSQRTRFVSGDQLDLKFIEVEEP
ncbi:MAG TPA: hydrogenase maturation nickel metallochaperone HypA [Acidobacteriaceae bacterium]|jgi:hydrogenase nickel incorporation protein HypA/HybF|nr:hydrogenase maturation nickel metallochaperone HypA [Acidobacteriaceae bacterium]